MVNQAKDGLPATRLPSDMGIVFESSEGAYFETDARGALGEQAHLTAFEPARWGHCRPCCARIVLLVVDVRA
jgi:hypothetical protein